MNWNDLERHFSAARLGRYRIARGGDAAKALADYAGNVLLSEAMLPMLNPESVLTCHISSITI